MLQPYSTHEKFASNEFLTRSLAAETIYANMRPDKIQQHKQFEMIEGIQNRTWEKMYDRDKMRNAFNGLVLMKIKPDVTSGQPDLNGLAQPDPTFKRAGPLPTRNNSGWDFSTQPELG